MESAVVELFNFFYLPLKVNTAKNRFARYASITLRSELAVVE